jgi:hypothetical protein
MEPGEGYLALAQCREKLHQATASQAVKVASVCVDKMRQLRRDATSLTGNVWPDADRLAALASGPGGTALRRPDAGRDALPAAGPAAQRALPPPRRTFDRAEDRRRQGEVRRKRHAPEAEARLIS